MSVKSTRYIRRADAITRIMDIKARLKKRDKYEAMSDTELENLLELLNDKVHGGEGFENYIILWARS